MKDTYNKDEQNLDLPIFNGKQVEHFHHTITKFIEKYKSSYTFKDGKGKPSDAEEEKISKKGSKFMPSFDRTEIMTRMMEFLKNIKKHPNYKSAASVAFIFVLYTLIRLRRQRQMMHNQKRTLTNSLKLISILQSIIGTSSKSLSLKQPTVSKHPKTTLPPSLETTEEVPISLLLKALQNKEIQHAFLNTCTCIFALRNADSYPSSTTTSHNATKSSNHSKTWKKVTFPESKSMREKLLSQLSASGCDQISTLASPKSIASQIQETLVYALPFLYLAMVYKMLKKFSNDQYDDKNSPLQKERMMNQASSQITTFKDVAGIEKAKLELQEVVQCLSNPLSYQRIGARVPRGVLLYGPPGAGKTLLARAVAGEAGRHCAFIACSGGDFVEVLVGRGAARVRELFSCARREALAKQSQYHQRYWFSNMFSQSSFMSINNNPNVKNTSDTQQSPLPQPSAVIFIDEIDALAKSRSGSSINGNFGRGCDEREQTLNQLLTEMDGFHNSSNSVEKYNHEADQIVTIVVFAATNRPDVLDPALMRPGRFDRHVHVALPDHKGREAILRLHASKIQLEKEGSQNEIGWETLSGDRFMKDFSGADIENVVNEAAFLAIRNQCALVGHTHLSDAIEKISKMKRSCLYQAI